MYALQVKYRISREANAYNKEIFSINVIAWRHNVIILGLYGM